MDHNYLMKLTVNMPMKTICINGEPYLQRYFVSEIDGVQTWLHRFLRNDQERHLHSHPWDAVSEVLVGGYREALEHGIATHKAGDINVIGKEKLHRIIKVEPNTWSRIRINPDRESEWYFVNEQGERETMKASPVDWHKNYASRPLEARI